MEDKNIASPSSSFWFAAIFLENIHGFSDEVKRDSLPSFFLNGGFGISLPEWENSWMSSERDQPFEVGQK